jgi:hypothetical protein
VRWTDGAAVSVRFKSMTVTDAVTFLNGLTWANTADHLFGFAAPTASGWSLVGQTPRQPNVTLRAGKFSYAAQPPIWVAGHGSLLHVETVNSAVVAADGVDQSYLTALYDGEVIVSGAAELYDPDTRVLRQVFPDGRRVTIDAFEDSGHDLTALRAIADSVTAVSQSQLTTLRSQVTTQVATLPQLSAGQLLGIDLAVRGVEDVTALCTTVSSVPWCINLDPAQAAEGQNDQVTADTVINGNRYVIAASPYGMTMSKANAAETGVLTPSYGTGDGVGWEFGIVQVPSTVTDVLVMFNPSPEQEGGEGFGADSAATAAEGVEVDVTEPAGIPVVVGDIWNRVEVGGSTLLADSSEGTS